jgi:hypothetical protein
MIGERWRGWSDGSLLLASSRERSSALVSVDRASGIRIALVDNHRWWVNEVVPPWATGRRTPAGSTAISGSVAGGIATEWWVPTGVKRPGAGFGDRYGLGGHGRGQGSDFGGGDFGEDGDPFGAGDSGMWLPGSTRGRGPRLGFGPGAVGIVDMRHPDWGKPVSGRHPSGTFTATTPDGKTVTDHYDASGNLSFRDVQWSEANGTSHEKSYDGRGNKQSEDTHTVNDDGSTTDTHTEWSTSTGDVLKESTTTTSADGTKSEANTRERNSDGTYSTTKTTTEKQSDGSTVITTTTDDGHGNTDEGSIMITPSSERPAPDDDTGAAEERPFAHAVFVGKSLGWTLPSPDPGEAEEGVPLAVVVQDQLGGLIASVVAGESSGWGDAASEQPHFPPLDEISVDGQDGSADWGIVHPQALVGRALRYGRASGSTRLARARLAALAAVVAKS